jgi:hypothetical protein
MSQAVPASFQSKYQNNVEMVLQQTTSMLLGATEVQDDASAEKIKIRDIFGGTLPQEDDERHGDTKYNNTPHDGVWLPKPNELYYAELCDNSDKLATSIDLGGQYVQEGAAVVNRAIDRRILEGFYGPVISGKEGTVTTPFPAGQILPVTIGGAAGAQRMNIAKLRAANMALSKAYVDLRQPRYMVLTAEQNNDLMTEVPATSSDFKGMYGQMGADGMVTGLLGWTFIHMELSNALLGTIPALSVDGSGYRRTPFWVKSGIRTNFWQRLRTMVDVLPQKKGSVQTFAGTTVAASRTQAGRCGIILNSEA